MSCLAHSPSQFKLNERTGSAHFAAAVRYDVLPRIGLPILFFLALCLGACGSSESGTQAQRSNASVIQIDNGINPFISVVQLVGSDLGTNFVSVSYVIAAKPSAASKPVSVTYSRTYLLNHGRVDSRNVGVPVFGLYSGYANQVSVQINFADKSMVSLPVEIDSATYADPDALYDKPTLLKTRAPGTALGFDYFALKSGVEAPIIIDSDGEIRWVGPQVVSGFSSAFSDNGFVVGQATSTLVFRLELDGTYSTFSPSNSAYTSFNHNIDFGKTALLGEVNDATDLESTIAEFSSSAGFFAEWDFDKIISDYMLSAGDDPSTFVRPGFDWFHSNAALYDASDNSLIVSSRENFLIKVDYDTKQIKWIFGDPTKYWWTFPSLRAKSLVLAGDGLYPIGQHALSFTPDGLLMIMNDGTASEEQPVGAPVGASRAYSAVSAYTIDPDNKTAVEAWRFDYAQSVYSPVCGSAYAASDGSVLADFATADNFAHARLVGLDSGHNVVFDFQYANTLCNTSWNAIPVHLEQMSF